MKVLIFTRSAWDNSNSTGNTMSNLWSGYDSSKIANLYFREAIPNNQICKLYFQISDIAIINSIINLRKDAGKQFNFSNIQFNNLAPQKEVHSITIENNLISYFRSNFSFLSRILQDFLWKSNVWKNKNLDNFLKEFSPDIIFFPCFASRYTHDVLWYCAKLTKAKVVLFHADDYLNAQGSGFISRFSKNLTKFKVKDSSLKADLNYCISPKQVEEYSNLLKQEMNLLFKGAILPSRFVESSIKEDQVIKLLYIGSTLYGRYKSLGLLAREISKINKSKSRFKLDIYSQYLPTKNELNTMVLGSASEFNGKIDSSLIPALMQKYDVLIHLESLDEHQRLNTRLSFSTKIVDYLASNKCIFAIGWEESASIEYLSVNDAAIIATNEEMIASQLNRIVSDPSILNYYAKKAFETCQRNHNIIKIQENFYDDLHKLCK